MNTNVAKNREAMIRWLVTGEQPANARHKIGKFDMTAYHSMCDDMATGCLAQAAISWWGTKATGDWSGATSHLGIKPYNANAIFYPHDYRHASAMHAALTLQNYFETGVVDWEGMA